LNLNAKKSGAKSRGDDEPQVGSTAEPPKPRANRRRVKRRATDAAPPTEAKRKATDARRGYDPYDSGELVKPKNPGVPRDLRSLGSWLKSHKKTKH
jgi:hypothetical protein